MARRARGRRRGHVSSRQSKPGGAVVERGPSPAGCGMASGTIRRGKSGAGSGVNGIVRLLPGREVALRVAAIGRGDRQGIVVVDVAEGAGHVGMPIGEQETRGAVVEYCRGPTYRVVAGGTICCCKRRASSGMHGIVGLLPGGQMALRVAAIGCSDRQAVVVADVAQIAGHIGVPIGQWETGRAVVEDACSPSRNRVASCAGRGRRRETRSHVIRHRSADRRGASKGRLMAAVAIRRIERVVVVQMAGRAGGWRRGHMRSSQCEPGDAVIERGRSPSGCCMTVRAVYRGERGARSRMDGSGRLLPGGQMALRISAGGRSNRQSVIVVDVASSASNVGVTLG